MVEVLLLVSWFLFFLFCWWFVFVGLFDFKVCLFVGCNVFV